MSDIALDMRAVTREYPGRDGRPFRANDGVTLAVPRGEILGLLGPNGAGKTTLVSQLLGLAWPTFGSLRVEGLDPVRDPDAVKRITGFLPQDELPMRRLEVHRALYFTGRLRGQAEWDARRQTDELIEELGLGDRADKYVDRLSGGSTRLVNFGMALMGRPKVLILDEPTNELDPRNRRLIWDAVTRRNAADGTTVLLVTHNVLEAELAVHRVAVMNAGRVVACGTPGELKERTGEQARVLLTTRDGRPLHDAEVRSLVELGEVGSAGRPGSYVIRSTPERVPALIGQVAGAIDLDRLDGLQLARASLEDVYLTLDGEHVSETPAIVAASPAADIPAIRPARLGFAERVRRSAVAFKFLWLEQLLEIRSSWPWTLMFGFLMPLAMVFGLSRIGSGSTDPESMLFIVSGAAVFSMATEGIATLAQRVGHLKSQGQMLYYASLPINKAAFIAALVFARLLLVAPGQLTPLLAARFLFDVPVVFSPMLLVVLPLSALALAALGMTIGSLIDDVELTVVVTNLLIFVLLLASPVLIPLESLPAPLRLLSWLLPPTYAADALRRSIDGQYGGALLLDLLVLVVMAVAGLTMAARWLRWRIS